MVTQCIRTRNGFVRLRFPEPHDWNGVVHFAAHAKQPDGPFSVVIVSDPAFRGVPLDCVAEKSEDGVNWVEAQGLLRVEQN